MQSLCKPCLDASVCKNWVLHKKTFLQWGLYEIKVMLYTVLFLKLTSFDP